MTPREETWRVEDGMVCADPSAGDRPPYGDVVALAPDASPLTDALDLSAALWPERAARMVAAINALRGQDVDDFAQLVEDAMAFRWYTTPGGNPEMPSRDDLREDYRTSLEQPQ